MFSTVQAVVLNKMDVLPYIDFNVSRFLEGVAAVNREAPVFQISCRTGEGLGDWIDWLKNIRS